MTDEIDPRDERARWVWREYHRIQVLHQELASLYRTKSTDFKRIRLLWNAIDEGEQILTLEGVVL